VDFNLINSLNRLPAQRPPSAGGGDASPANETRVFWILTIVTLAAAAAFALGSLLLWVVGQCVALRTRSGFRQHGVHALVWLPTVVIALSDFLKLVVLQVGKLGLCARACLADAEWLHPRGF
jgi:hypothetical protein